jgi:pilus assembly protein CpaB
MSARQLIVLVVAAIAAVGALLLIRGMGARDDAPAERAAPIVGQQVLVAARDIAQGAALTPSDLAVATFPDTSVAPGFVRLSAQPSAQADYVGAVTRRPFVRGEPITTSSVIHAEGRGFMAAQLAPGYRAVAIDIDPQSAAGGYIQPNDHVDVIVTARARSSAGGDEQVSSNIVLEDVRVLALGETTQAQTGGGDGPETIEARVAVLELTAEDARTLALADELGKISLALRGVQVETVGMRASTSRGGGLTQSGSVRIHAYGVVTGGGQ